MNENFKTIKEIVINETNLMTRDKFPTHLMNDINSKLIKDAAKLYKFDKKQIKELKYLAGIY